MDQIFGFHIERLRATTLDKLTLGQVPEWITRNTSIKGRPYSFKKHEFQERILREGSQETVIRKCSQVGISEVSCRMALALCAIVPHYTIGYTLPTATFAAQFMTTRVDPIIHDSPYLKQAINVTNDNSGVKQFGSSFLYVKGAQSNNAPISVPMDHLIHDELDFSDDEVISNYHSRLTHSEYARKTKLSTPTLPGVGIDREFQSSRRWFNFLKCNHCNHQFLPDYYRNVRVPGFTGELMSVTKSTLHTMQWEQAYVECPACGKAPSLLPEHREWVCENPGDSFIAVGFQVTPFDAPLVTTPAKLVLASTQYKRNSDFVNFNLGLPAEDVESTITAEDLAGITIDRQAEGDGAFVIGLDMGLECHCIVAKVLPDSTVINVLKEVIPVSKVQERRRELALQFRPRMTVVDSQPYTETVLQMQKEDGNLFGAVYQKTKGIETHRVKDQDEDKKKGKTDLRQVNVNRDVAFDGLMADIRAKRLLNMRDPLDQRWSSQLRDMKRAKVFTEANEIAHVWKKSGSGDDHFHHAQLYAWVAAQMMGVTDFRIILPVGMEIIRIQSSRL